MCTLRCKGSGWILSFFVDVVRLKFEEMAKGIAIFFPMAFQPISCQLSQLLNFDLVILTFEHVVGPVQFDRG